MRSWSGEAAPKTIMSSYNPVNGTYANENAHLLQDILRRDWGLFRCRCDRLGRLQRPCTRRKERLHAGNARPGGDAVRELLAAVQSGKDHRGGCGCPAGRAADAGAGYKRCRAKSTAAALTPMRTMRWPAAPPPERRAAENDGGILPLAAGKGCRYR